MSSPSTSVAAPEEDRLADALRRRNDDQEWHQRVEQERLRRLEEERGLEEFRQERQRTIELAAKLRRLKEERGLKEYQQELLRKRKQ